MKSANKWKHFERLVAAIHKLVDQGADVRWNELINGRQFDVTVRFKKGMYEYLTVIECKSSEKAVPVEKIEAFVTKSADAHAHHAVMASTSGFQEGAREVARKHNMTLIHVTESSEIDLSLFGAQLAGTTDALHIERIELEYEDGEKKLISLEAHEMTYYARNIQIQYLSEIATIENLIECHKPRFLGGEIGQYSDHSIDVPVGACVIGPDDGEIPLKPLARINLRVGMIKATRLIGPAKFEPYFLVPKIQFTNVATGEEKTFSQYGLSLGQDTVFSTGEFYQSPLLSTYYYCDSISENIATLYLVESFQVGQLFQATFKMETKYANHYVRVTDKSVLQRLQRRLDAIKAREKSSN